MEQTLRIGDKVVTLTTWPCEPLSEAEIESLRLSPSDYRQNAQAAA